MDFGSDEETKGEISREPRASIRVNDSKIYEGEGKASDIFTDETGLAFTCSNP